MKRIYILYRTTRTETSEYYIGIHGIDTDKFPDFNDGYLGSGNRIKASVKKHGSKEFKRTILEISESRDVIEALEKAIVTVEMIADPLCLNLAPGGRGGKNCQAISDSMKGYVKTPDHCQALSDALKGRPSPTKGIPREPRSVETRKKISDSKKGVSTGPFTAERCQKISDVKRGISTGPKSAETRKKLSDSMKEIRRRKKQNDSVNLTDFIQ